MTLVICVEYCIIIINSPCSFHGTKLKEMIPELCSVLTKFPQLCNLM